ncbi:MAG: hypothetical protein OXD31_16590 [Chloroflexi bacterium]|nr:hypothetical protein [Chloroflexota bacterium]
MTTQTTLAQPQPEDYSHIEPLPDPPREPDMVQRKSLSTLDGTLGTHFAAFSDVLLTGEIYYASMRRTRGSWLPTSSSQGRSVTPRRSSGATDT